MTSLPVLLLLTATIAAAVAALAALALPGRLAAAVRALLADRLDALDRGQERLERALRDELANSRGEAVLSARQLREEVRGHLDGTRAELAAASCALREELGASVRALQADNGKRLDEMRRTVDEQLQGTLERRLGESFRLVSERLEAVQRGLGEMQTLASGVGDLKKVLANVKVRGTWGEIQLGSLLDQLLAPEQLARNVATRPGSSERVEFAIRLPGRADGSGEVLLPIDAKFPIEDYQRLVEASERADAPAVEECARALEARIKGNARDVHHKYLNPPHTTDFAILFLPTEGLYAEVIRRPGLVETLQREQQVVVAGPTTLAALLNSLQMGFRTLAIQRRSSEVWGVLGAVKAEFGKFGLVLDKVQRKLNEASTTIDDANVRRRAVERSLRRVAELPSSDAGGLLPELAVGGEAPLAELVEPPPPAPGRGVAPA